MFSLLITIVSIALAIALTVAVIYYGGDASRKSTTRAAAMTLINQAAQINAAGTIAVAQGSSWPAAAPQFAPPYLSSMPVPPKSAYVAGTPAALDWTYYVPSPFTRHFVLKNKVSKEVCMAVNKEFGMVGIPAVWTGKDLVQCFGTGVATGPDNAPAYTFFYDPLGSTPGEDASALAESTKNALDAGAVGPTPGYPRLCPDNSSITSGVCSADASAPAEPAAPVPDEAGFFVITGTSGDGHPALASEGFATTCPAGAIDPTGSNATPVITNPAEQLNVDAVMRSGWLIQPDWNPIFNTGLTRTWCFPAMKSESLPAGPIALAADGDVSNVTLTPAIAGADPMDYHWAMTATATFTAKGQAWTVLASTFEADVWHSNSANNPWMVGDKLAVGRGAGVTQSYFGNVPTLNYGGMTYAGEKGTIVLALAPPQLLFNSPSNMDDIYVNFPATRVGFTSTPLTISIRNLGTQPVSMSGPAVTGPYNLGVNSCAATLAPGAACSVSMTFSPTSQDYTPGRLSFGTEGVDLEGDVAPSPDPGFWVIRATVNYQEPKLESLGFQATCPSGSVNPESLSATPVTGLPGDETLNVDGVMDAWWQGNGEGWPAAIPTSLSRVYCIAAMSDEVGALGDLTPKYYGAADHTYLPDDSRWIFGQNRHAGNSEIAAATFNVKGTTWTLAATSGQNVGLNMDMANPQQMHQARKIAIGKTSRFAGTYYAGGATISDGYFNYTDAGFIRFGDMWDLTKPVGLVLSTDAMSVRAQPTGPQWEGYPVSIYNAGTADVTISGLSDLGSLPFTVRSTCDTVLQPGKQCQLFPILTRADAGTFENQFTLYTSGGNFDFTVYGD